MGAGTNAGTTSGNPPFPITLERTGHPADRAMWFAGSVGFFFVFRAGLTFLFFQRDPVMGSAVAIAAGLALLYGAVLYVADEGARERTPLQARPVRWILAMLVLALASVAWTGARSAGVALAYWMGMAADVATVLLLVRRGDALRVTEGLMQGAVWGAAALGAVAWCSPAAADMRLGNDAFLHPNTLGLEIGLAALMAQYFAGRAARWKWVSAALAVTLLRTLSKTAIVAFVAAECWWLIEQRALTRRAKLRLGALALAVVACFWGLLSRYLDAYNNSGSGNQLETLTGRTVLWAAALALGLERPWFGHGIYSFKAMIPALGDFAPVHAHNEALQQFFEFGAAGVVVAAGVYGSFYRLVRRARRSELGAGTAELPALAMGLLIFSLVRGLTDTVPLGLSFPLWLLAALAICLVSGAGDTASEAVRP